MAIIQISRIQHRRGLQQDLPNLASAELGWSIDSRKLYIGNGTLTEGAPVEGKTEILTEHSDILALFDQFQFKGLPYGAVAITADNEEGFRRTLQEKLDDFVNVRDFGALGNGDADDTDAINRALNNAYAYSSTIGGIDMHRTVYFPAGYYLVSDTIVIPPFVRIVGDGKQNTIIGSKQDVTTIARLSDNNGAIGANLGDKPGSIPTQARDYAIADIGFENGGNQLNPCVVIDGGFDIYFHRVSFTGASMPGSDAGSSHAAVYLSGASGFFPTQRVFFNECEFALHNAGIETFGEVDGLVIKGCSFVDLHADTVLSDTTNGVIITASSRMDSTDITERNLFTTTPLDDRRGSEQQTLGVKESLAVGEHAISFSLADYKHLIMDYMITDGSETRTGTFKSSANASGYQHQDDYIESDDLQIELSVDSDTGAVSYNNASSSAAEMSYTVKYYL
jgi:hypothetical protein